MFSGEFVRQFDHAGEVRDFPFGRFEIVHVAGISLGRATYRPGWKWPVHNAPLAGTALDLLPGTVFHITTTPHDSWVHGEAPYVSLHVLKSQ